MDWKSILATGVVLSAVLCMPVYGYAAEASSSEANVQKITEFYDVVLDQGKVGETDKFVHPDVVDHAPWPDQKGDLAGFKAGYTTMRRGFPDLHVKVERTVAQGDLVVVHFRMSGTQSGPFMGAPGSDKKMDVEAIDIMRLQDGLIAEHWGVTDTAAMAQQLGQQKPQDDLQ